MEHVDTRLQSAIEDLRIKYEKIRLAEEAAKKEKEDAERAKAAAEEKKACENDWSLADPEMEALRQARIAALKETAASRRGHREAGNGEMRDIVEEEFLREVTSAAHVVVHFFHPEFETCRVMDKHLRELARRALQTKFLRINGASRQAAELRVEHALCFLLLHPTHI